MPKSNNITITIHPNLAAALNWASARLKEPSTQVGLGTFCVGVQLLLQHDWLGGLAAVFGGAGIVLKEGN